MWTEKSRFVSNLGTANVITFSNLSVESEKKWTNVSHKRSLQHLKNMLYVVRDMRLLWVIEGADDFSGRPFLLLEYFSSFFLLCSKMQSSLTLQHSNEAFDSLHQNVYWHLECHTWANIYLSVKAISHLLTCLRANCRSLMNTDCVKMLLLRSNPLDELNTSRLGIAERKRNNIKRNFLSSAKRSLRRFSILLVHTRAVLRNLNYSILHSVANRISTSASKHSSKRLKIYFRYCLGNSWKFSVWL